MTVLLDDEIPNELTSMLSNFQKKMKLTSSPKQEKIFSLNINQSNKSQLEK